MQAYSLEGWMRRQYDDERSREMEQLINEVADVAAYRYAMRGHVECVRALGNFGQEAAIAVPDLIRCLRHRQPSVRRAAAVALGRIGPKAEAAAPQLSTLRDDRSRPVREAVEEALNLISG